MGEMSIHVPLLKMFTNLWFLKKTLFPGPPGREIVGFRQTPQIQLSLQATLVCRVPCLPGSKVCNHECSLHVHEQCKLCVGGLSTCMPSLGLLCFPVPSLQSVDLSVTHDEAIPMSVVSAQGILHLLCTYTCSRRWPHDYMYCSSAKLSGTSVREDYSDFLHPMTCTLLSSSPSTVTVFLISNMLSSYSTSHLLIRPPVTSYPTLYTCTRKKEPGYHWQGMHKIAVYWNYNYSMYLDSFQYYRMYSVHDHVCWHPKSTYMYAHLYMYM